MKRIAVFLFALALLVSACVPAIPTEQPASEAPSVDTQATDEALAATLAAETLISQPTPTLVPSDTPEPTATETATATATPTETATIDPNATGTETLTPDPNATATETLTLDPNITITTTGTPPTATATGTLSTPTPTETLYARFYGTLPPAIPYGKIRLSNKSKAEAYISLDCTTVDGYKTILEYPVSRGMRVSAPAGKYTYVAWVGGRVFQGYFSLGKNNEMEIVLEKDKVTIK